jgi:hypothetical protein
VSTRLKQNFRRPLRVATAAIPRLKRRYPRRPDMPTRCAPVHGDRREAVLLGSAALTAISQRELPIGHVSLPGF